MSINDHLNVRIKRQRDPETRKSNLCLQPSEPLKWWLTILSGLIVAGVVGIFSLFASALLWAHEMDSGQGVIVNELKGLKKSVDVNTAEIRDQDKRLREIEKQI